MPRFPPRGEWRGSAFPPDAGRQQVTRGAWLSWGLATPSPFFPTGEKRSEATGSGSARGRWPYTGPTPPSPSP
ncbi:hypothetical protein MATL_G00140080 [Megalops atlanticus]|uniref:Uncharacterized protein n=1 Tax=Megalops atlanticus TaxID=7932 RepID=A0A9D3PTF4_MEGAT|nr:hypothetical protein MATL_G00140080 [Megalops atlanticus]